jgi:hypothetical protein
MDKNNYQSNLFKEGFIKDEQIETFKNDLLNINSLESSNLENLIQVAFNIRFATTKQKEQELANSAEKEGIIEDTEKLDSLYRFVNYFFEVFSEEKKYTHEIIFNDLSIKFDLNKSQFVNIKSVLEILKKKTPQYESEKRKMRYERGVFPNLKGFNTTVELRAIFNKELEIGESFNSYIENVKIDEENPVVAIISVAISLDSEKANNLFFQTSPEHLKLLVEELKAAIYKSELLEEKFNKKP